MGPAVPSVCDLLLVGGGHSHVQVLKAFGMAPLPGVRLTVLAREVLSPYSGMLPGCVAGWYERPDIHIDLGRLCRFAGARLIDDEAVVLDLDGNAIHCRRRPPLRFDLLSINCGAAPEAPTGVGVPVKPIGRFLPAWESMRKSVRAGHRVVFVGGGAGGVELALAARQALGEAVQIRIVVAELLPGHSVAAKKLLRRKLAQAGIDLIEGLVTSQATEGPRRDGRAGVLHLHGGAPLSFDHLFWATGVIAPDWVRDSALATDAKGFIRVDATLQSSSHAQVYAAGDIIRFPDPDLPKSGVYAVRAGPLLAENLRRALQGRSCKAFRPQRRFLSLIGTGDGGAVVSWGPFAAQGRWAWRWKDRIDRRFMEKYQRLPSMEVPLELPPLRFGTSAEPLDPMRCGGCGAKLGAASLQRALSRLPPQRAPALVQGIGDDAAVLNANPAPLVLSIDGFRTLVDDPYLFGRIVAHHSLNDIYAMGAQPTSALALATVPLMAEAMMEDDLHQMLAGAADVLNASGIPLVGGHSAEGAELSLGLSVTGALASPALSKGGARPGDRLILTKPLGTGVLLAAQMRGLAPIAWLQGALRCMDCSNGEALAVLRVQGVRAATDVTGFGLIGHLTEMLDASGCGAQLRLDRMPALDGALAAFRHGAASVLQGSNERFLDGFELRGCAPADWRVKLLADPQTAGGLLASVPSGEAAGCLEALQAAGYRGSADIGFVTSAERLILAGKE